MPFYALAPFISSCNYDDKFLSRARCTLVEASMNQLFLLYFIFDPMKFPQLHIAAIRGECGMFERFLDYFLGNGLIGIKFAIGAAELNNIVKSHRLKLTALRVPSWQDDDVLHVG